LRERGWKANFVLGCFWRRDRHRACHERGRRLQPVDPACVPLAGGRAHGSLADSRFFHFSPHRVEIVAGRDYRKQQDQQTSQSQQQLARAESALLHNSAFPPQPICRQHQKHPRQIEQQLHYDESQKMRAIRLSPQTYTAVFQKFQTQVNVTGVLALRRLEFRTELM
jgi:hypothetical protein